MVGFVSQREDVRRDLVAPLALVDVDGTQSVDGEPLVRVDGHAKQARVGLQTRFTDQGSQRVKGQFRVSR